MDNKRKKGLSSAYERAGVDFLAYRLQHCLFKKIENPVDIALHNDMLEEIELLVDGENLLFFKNFANILLNRPKCWYRSISELIIHISKKGKKND